MILLWTKEKLLGEPGMHWLDSQFQELFKREHTHIYTCTHADICLKPLI